MTTRKIHMKEEVQAMDYYARTKSYIVGTSRKADYRLPEDELFGPEGMRRFFSRTTEV